MVYNSGAADSYLPGQVTHFYHMWKFTVVSIKILCLTLSQPAKSASGLHMLLHKDSLQFCLSISHYILQVLFIAFQFVYSKGFEAPCLCFKLEHLLFSAIHNGLFSMSGVFCAASSEFVFTVQKR
jgi:hypothetical protein